MGDDAELAAHMEWKKLHRVFFNHGYVLRSVDKVVGIISWIYLDRNVVGRLDKTSGYKD